MAAHGNRDDRRTGALLVAAAALLWGTVGPAGRIAFGWGVAPAQAALWRAGGAFAVLATAGALARPRVLTVRARDLPLLAGYGLIGVATFMTVYFYAIRLSTVATAAMLLYTAPLWVTLFARLLFGEALTRARVLALALAVCGSALVVRAYDPAALKLSVAGTAAGLAAGLTYALYSIFAKRTLARYGSWTTLIYGLGFGTVFLLAFAAAGGASTGLPPRGALPVLAYLALVPTLLSHILYVNGLRRIEAGRAALLATIEPVAAALFGFLLLGERLEPWQWLGGVLIISGVGVTQADPRARGDARA